MRILREYDDNDEYIKHQLEKTMDAKTIGDRKKDWDQNVKIFESKFSIFSSLSDNANILCVGSRYGEEVEAWRNRGYENVTGIDLIFYHPYTIKMDMHNLEFSDNIFNVVYTNSLDHSSDLETAIKEIFRVATPNGGVMVDIELFNNHGDYETIEFTSIYDVKDVVDSLGMKYVFHDIIYGQNLREGGGIIDLTKRTLMFMLRNNPKWKRNELGEVTTTHAKE